MCIIHCCCACSSLSRSVAAIVLQHCFIASERYQGLQALCKLCYQYSATLCSLHMMLLASHNTQLLAHLLQTCLDSCHLLCSSRCFNNVRSQALLQTCFKLACVCSLLPYVMCSCDIKQLSAVTLIVTLCCLQHQWCHHYCSFYWIVVCYYSAVDCLMCLSSPKL
jgi:hypothetical protein